MKELKIPIEMIDPDPINNSGKSYVAHLNRKTFGLAEGRRNKKSAIQFLKFIFVGILNTVVDLGVLNLLMSLFGSPEKEHYFIFFKALSFIVAVSFSYFCNKYFVFNDKERRTTKAGFRKEGGIFFVVSMVGLVLNVSISSFFFFLLVKVYGSQTPLYLLASGSALLGSAAALSWNFFGYKRWVFKK
jgi:putative flippase GtrA